MSAPAILITDDEAPARQRLRDLLSDCAAEFPHTVAGEAKNGREAIERINEGGVDIVLMDIRMPIMDGIEAAQHIAGMESPPQLIFTTAYEAYALKAFEVNAIDYLVKPFRAERLLAALKKVPRRPITQTAANALAQAQPEPAKRKHLSAHERGRITLIPIEDVLYLRAELKYVTVRVAQREHLIEESLVRLEEEFAERFVRIHRNCLVAKEAIAGFERGASEDESGWAVIVRHTNEKLQVSRRQAHIVRELRGG